MSEQDGASVTAGEQPRTRPVPIGRQRQPRTLVMTGDDVFAAAVAELVPTCQRVEDYEEVEQSEWDLLITTLPFVTGTPFVHKLRQPAGHLFVLSFVSGVVGTVKRSEGGSASVWFQAGSRSREYMTPDALPAEFERLVRDDLLAVVERRTGEHDLLVASSSPRLQPFLTTGLGEPLAGVAPRDGGGVLLALPKDVQDREGWVKAGLQFFRQHDPGRFREVPGWEEQPSWLTAEERRLQAELDRVRSERSDAIAAFEVREQQLMLERARMAAAADAGLRRLLTSQGDDLEDAVTQALTTLGFVVTPMDPQAEQGNKLEDLRVVDPDDDGWEALVEVKGKTRGASWSDVTATDRFVRRYRDEKNRWPSAVWYVVNQFAGQDPARRDPVLASQEVELGQWANDSGGLAIDTAELFKLVVAVERGETTVDDARRQLRGAAKRYVYGGPDRSADSGRSSDTDAAAS
jgi:hypothetical protein